MASTTGTPPRLMNTPEWVFPWRDRKKSFFPMLAAQGIAAAAFVALLGMVHVKVISPKPMAPRKASLIYLADDAEGRALALRAQEGGPFPSRFEPAQWEGMAALEAEAVAMTRRKNSYSPKLRELPEQARIAPLELAAKGEPVFPKRPPVERLIPSTVGGKPKPMIYPLSGLPADAIPATLPPFAGAVEGTMASSSWRFLLRLDAQGGVAECVSLEKGGEAGALDLKAWLQQVRFRPPSGKPLHWVAVGIGFSNSPAADGPDNR